MDVDVAGAVQLPITCLILCMVEDMAADAEMSALPHRPHAQVYLCPTLQTELCIPVKPSEELQTGTCATPVDLT